ncbi:MAG: 4a-hydroxytetrahydrobiopterin dehydratase [Deltaproteobacteria bacterium]|nr:4a-hydroxytetrahydrobiopterin dehydratase [Deltaproteobacteria bacterium]
MGLAAKACEPCRGGVAPLTAEEAGRYLLETPGWTLSDDATSIERAYTFRNFALAMEFVRKVGDLAEREGHHPDIAFGWGYCRIAFQTHKIRGLHENDFIMAAKVDELAGSA